MTTPQLASRPTNRALPLLRSEISRMTHRRLVRVLALLFLGGIILISVIAFATHRSTAGSTLSELQANQAEQQQFWEQCAERADPNRLERRCGPEPVTQPVEDFDYGENKQYRAKELLPVALLGSLVAGAGIAFIVGASAGGAEWSSRSMSLQLLWETRRLRLLVIKWLGLVVVTVALAALGTLLAVGLSALTASLRGTWSGQLENDLFGNTSFGQVMALMGLRGLAVVAISATFGYAIAILVRNTGASLGVAFVYFVLVENAARLVLFKYGTEPFMLTTNTVAFLIPEGLDVPGRTLSPAEIDPNSDFGTSITVHLSNTRALLTMLGYSALLVVPAVWSFTRRDVG